MAHVSFSVRAGPSLLFLHQNAEVLAEAASEDEEAIASLLRDHLDRHPPRPNQARRSENLQQDASPADLLEPEDIQAHVAWQDRHDHRIRTTAPLELESSLKAELHVPVWVAVISIPISAFLTSFATEAGKAAYAALQDLLAKIWSLKIEPVTAKVNSTHRIILGREFGGSPP